MQMLYFSEVQLSVPEPSQATHLPSAAARLATHFSSAAHPQSTNFPSAVHPQPTNLLTAHLPRQLSLISAPQPISHLRQYIRAINRSSAHLSRQPISHLQQYIPGQSIAHQQHLSAHQYTISSISSGKSSRLSSRTTTRRGSHTTSYCACTLDRESARLTKMAVRRTNATSTLTGGGRTDELESHRRLQSSPHEFSAVSIQSASPFR